MVSYCGMTTTSEPEHPGERRPPCWRHSPVWSLPSQWSTAKQKNLYARQPRAMPRHGDSSRLDGSGHSPGGERRSCAGRATRASTEEPGIYGAQALWLALRKAETYVGVSHMPFRAVHGFRRGVAGDVARASGDAWLGVQFIGDRDPDRIGEYVLERGDELERAVRLLDRSWIDGPKPSTECQPAGIPARIKSDPLQFNLQAGAGGLEPPTSRLTAGRSAN
jgi:hypothetical protein